jgi:hypothetical protein
MRLALGLALACTSLFAQFRQLATTDDGSRLYFSSNSRIFVYSPQGLQVFAQQDADELGWPDASGNAEIVAFSGGSRSSLALGSGVVFRTGIGRAAISRNGRFALFGPTVLDLRTMATYAAPSGTIGSIASDGTAAIPGFDAIQILRASGVTSYPAQGIPNSAVIDDRGATVAYEAQGRIIRLDLATGEQSIAADPGLQPRLSNDGEVMLYLAPDALGVQQVWTGNGKITTEADGITEAVLSGDGRTAYAVANSARVLRVDLASGQIADITEAITKPAPNRPRVVSLTAGGGQLCYQVENATSVVIQPGFGVVPGPSACLTARPAITTAYTLTAANGTESATASVTLEVTSVAIASFTNDPAYSPAAGGPVTLSWTTQNAVSVRITGLGLPQDPLPLSGSVIVRPVTNTSYTLIAYGANGQAVSSVLYIFVR